MNPQTMKNTANLVLSKEKNYCAIQEKPQGNNELKVNRSFSVKQYKNNKHLRTKETNRTSFKFFANISRKPLHLQETNTLETQFGNVLGHVPLHEPFRDLQHYMKSRLKHLINPDFGSSQVGELGKKGESIIVSGRGISSTNEDKKIGVQGNLKVLNRKYFVLKEVPTLKECRAKKTKHPLGETVFTSQAAHIFENYQNKLTYGSQLDVASNQLMLSEENESNTFTSFTSDHQMNKVKSENLPFNEFFGTTLEFNDDIKGHVEQIIIPDFTSPQSDEEDDKNHLCLASSNDSVIMKELISQDSIIKLNKKIYTLIEVNSMEEVSNVTIKNKCNKDPKCQFKNTEKSGKAADSNESAVFLVKGFAQKDDKKAGQIMEEVSNMTVINKCKNDPKSQFKNTEKSEKPADSNESSVLLVKDFSQKDDKKAGQITTENTLKCQGCSLTFQNMIDFYKHIHTSHEIVQCDKCNKTYTNFQQKVNHLKTDKSVQKKCDKCNEVFANQFCYDRHLNKKKLCVTRYNCKICGIHNKNKEEALEHKKTHDGEKEFSCIQCSKTFTNKSSLKSHSFTHTNEKKVVCVICDKRFFSTYHLKLHTKNVHTDGKHVCPICNKSFKTTKQLNEHSTIHSGQLPFLCSVCGKRYRLKSSLDKHCIRHGEKLLQCSICDKKFFVKKLLIDHMRVHTGDYLKCSLCSHSFTCSKNLKKHMDLHSAEKRFQCELCDRKFYQKQCLISHLNSHKKSNKHIMKDRRCSICHIAAGELNCPLSFHLQEHRQKGENKHSFVHKDKQFLCNICGKAFSQKQILRSHLKTHSGEERHQCTICKEYFSDNSSLKRHQNLHAEKRLYECAHCSKSFLYSISLINHICRV